MSEIKVEELKTKGNQHVKDEKFNLAKDCYSEALLVSSMTDDTRVALLCNRALCYLKLQEWKLCIKDCDAAIVLSPSSSKALFRRASVFVATNEHAKALIDLNTLLRYDTQNKAAIKMMLEVQKQVRKDQANATPVNNILDNAKKDSSKLLDGIKTLIGLTYDDKSHAVDFARKDGLEWIADVINRELALSLQSKDTHDLSLLMAAIRLLSACSNHQEFVLKYVDVNNNDNGLFNDNRFVRCEVKLVQQQKEGEKAKLSLVSVCSLLAHYNSAVVQIVIVLLMSIVKVVPASSELVSLDNIKRKLKNRSSEGDDNSSSSQSESVVVDADIQFNLEPSTVQAVICGFRCALLSKHVDIFSLLTDSLCAFMSEAADYFEPNKVTDTRLENLLERKIRLRETRILKGRSLAHAKAAVGCGLIAVLVNLMDDDEQHSAAVRHNAGNCLGKLINFFDDEDKTKDKLKPFLRGSSSGETHFDESKRVVELSDDCDNEAEVEAPSVSKCRRRAAVTAVLLISKPELGAWALSLPGGVSQLLLLVSTLDPRCQELAAEVMCLAASNDAASGQLSTIVASGTLSTLLHSPFAGTRAAAASTITKLSLKAKALSEDSSEVSQILNTVLAVLKAANNQKLSTSTNNNSSSSNSSNSNSSSSGGDKADKLTSFSSLDAVGEQTKKLSLKQKELEHSSGSSSGEGDEHAVTMTSVERAVEVLAAMVGKTFIKEEIVHGSFRVVSCVAELAKLDLDVRSTAAYGFTHIFAALTVTNAELRAKALAEKDISPEQFEQMQELQRIKTKDEGGNVIEEKKEDSDPDSTELCRRRIQRIVAVNSISTLVKYLSAGSVQTKEAAARTLRQICVEESSRGLMLQQGGFKACCSVAVDEDVAKNTRLECAHVVAKTLVTTNPNLLSQHQRLGAIKPLVMLCKESDSTNLQQFEALLALTNILSCGEDEHDRFTAEKGVSAVHYLIFSDNLMVRRAAMETLCNMSSHEALLKLLRDGDKLRLWLGLAEDWANESIDANEAFLTARAAAGTLAGAVSDAQVASAMVKQDCARTIVTLMESENKELIHRALVMVLELLTSEDSNEEGDISSNSKRSRRTCAEHLVSGSVIPSIGLVTKLGEPFLADLAMKCAKALSEAMKGSEAVSS